MECFKKEEAARSKEEKDRAALIEYITKTLGDDFINPRVLKQIKDYVQEYNYTYSGILKALTYFFEVKGNSTERTKLNGGLGIVPYVYNDAFNYYYSIWLAQQKNEHFKPEEYVIPVREVHIPIPQRNVKKRNRFSFLDEEEVEE